jgi:excisionase family DNA binding protein
MERHGAPEYGPLRPLLTVPELADRLRVGRTTVYRLVNSGSIRAVTVGQRIRFRPEDVDRYLEREEPAA